MNVTIPEGSQPGSVFQVQQPDGQVVSVQVPPGGSGGMQMQVPLQPTQTIQATVVAVPQEQFQQQQFQQQQFQQPQQYQQQQFQQPQQFQALQVQKFQQPGQVQIMGQPQMQIMPQNVANQSQFNQAPVPYPQNGTLIEKYGGGMFGCDCNCLMGLLCYPITVGQVAGFASTGQRGTNDTGTCCCYCIGTILVAACCMQVNGCTCVGCNARGMLEQKLSQSHPGMAMNNSASNLLCHCCCPCFAIGQELRAITAYKQRLGIGAPDSTEMVR